MLSETGYIAGSAITDFSDFPETSLEWNEFLLESVLRQSGKVNIVYLDNDPFKYSNAVYVADEYKNDSAKTFLVKIITREMQERTFETKEKMLEWLKERKLAQNRLPNYLQNKRYFVSDKTGVHPVTT